MTHVAGPLPEWNPTTRFAFRFFCIYFVVVWLNQTAGLLTNVGPWNRLTETLGRWPITHLLGLPEHGTSVPGTMEYLPQYVLTMTLTALTAVVALAWSLLDRRRLTARGESPSHQGST